MYRITKWLKPTSKFKRCGKMLTWRYYCEEMVSEISRDLDRKAFVKTNGGVVAVFTDMEIKGNYED